MSQINCYEAIKHWNKDGQSEVDYLKAVQFVALDENRRISLSTDEEGNNQIILTPKAARYVAEELLKLIKVVE